MIQSPTAMDSLNLMPREPEMDTDLEYSWDFTDEISEAVEKTQRYFTSSQHPDGYWWFELESNVTITAEYLMLLVFAGIEDEIKISKMANHILKQRRPDGTWAIYKGGRGDISTTVEAYFALKLAGYDAQDARLEAARRFVVTNGGLAKTRVFTKIFLALFGQLDWKFIPCVPVEIMLLFPWFPLNIYKFSSWARATFVPLSVVLDAKPVKVLPRERGVAELSGCEGDGGTCSVAQPALSWKRFFLEVDKILKATENSRIRVFRRRGLEEALRWIHEHQEETGDWAGIQPAMVNSILALLVQGHDVSYGPIQKGFEALERFAIEREDELLLQSCISPVWDTALTGLALSRSGLKGRHTSLTKACRWLAGKQIFQKGDWSMQRPDLEPGGWAFEFVNNRYPDIDDTAVVLMFLSSWDHGKHLAPVNFKRAVDWVLGMQGKDGGWGAFDADNNMDILNRIPFGDLEAMIDPSTPDITGRVLEMLGCIDYTISDKSVIKALRFLKKTQEADGLWWGRWGVNYIYGTWSVLAGLSSVGEDMTSPYVKKAVTGLKVYQNADGGWGEGCESYNARNIRVRGRSTPSQTAWAILALIAAGEEMSPEVTRGVEYLLREQGADGTWEEEEFTATGFPRHFMLKYHNYRNCFPLMALGRFLGKLDEVSPAGDSQEVHLRQGH